MVRKWEWIERVAVVELWLEGAVVHCGRLCELIADWSLVSLVEQAETIVHQHATTLAVVEVNLQRDRLASVSQTAANKDSTLHRTGVDHG